jgi:hypothetical protein
MQNSIKILIICGSLLVLTGCQDLIKLTGSPEKIIYFNLNKEQEVKDMGDRIDSESGSEEDLTGILDEEFLEKYTLELGRTDDDIQSMRRYTFDLVEDLSFELQGVDARSSILEFKKDNLIIFRMVNYDYEIDKELIDSMYPNLDNYSAVGGHTNILILEDDNYVDDLLIFENSLRINGQLVFE